MIERLGIFGGTFDPPHIGHQVLAAEALSQLGLDKVLWVLTPDPPHKRGNSISLISIRLEMVEAAIEDCEGFELSRVEIDRPPPHYAVDTLHLLMEKKPTAELFYLMGADSLSDLHQWYDYQEFIKSCHALGVMRRPGENIDLDYLGTKIYGIKSKVQFVETPLLEISASQIRHRIKSGYAYRYYLPPAVYQIIKKYSLYQNFN